MSSQVAEGINARIDIDTASNTGKMNTTKDFDEKEYLNHGGDDDTLNKSVINVEKHLKKLHVDHRPLLDNKLTPFLPDQLSEITSESDTESDTDSTNLLEDLSPRAADEPSFSRPSSCIFVASLAASLTDSELNASVTKEFNKYGKIISVKVLRDPANRPYAFVQYASDEDALNALSQAQGTTLNDRNIRCERAKVNRTVFISSSFTNPLENKLTAENVIELMSKFGELEQVVPSRDQMYKKNYYPLEVASSWFVQYAYRDDAIRAYLQMKLNYDYMVEWAQNVEVPPRFNLLLSKAKIGELERLERERLGKQPIFIDNKSIFIGQLNFKVTKPLLLERFSKYGEIETCNLIHKQEQGKCFAFIKYKVAASAATALERENHSVFMDKILHVQIREVSNSRRGSVDSSRSFQGPQLNLAPPPLNIGRRASTGSFNKIMYPLPAHLQSNIPSPYVYASMQEPRRNTINAGSPTYRTTPPNFNHGGDPQSYYNERNHHSHHYYGSKNKTYATKAGNDVDEERTAPEGGMYSRKNQFDKKISNDNEQNTIEEEEDNDYENDEEREADETPFLEHESNSSYTTFSAGTGTFPKHNNSNNTNYGKYHGHKWRRNIDGLRLNRMDPNFYYGPPLYYSMEYCPPSGGPVVPPPSHIMQAPGTHLTGHGPPSQHSPFFYYFPMPPPTPTFTNPFPHDHSGGFNYMDKSAPTHDKEELEY